MRSTLWAIVVAVPLFMLLSTGSLVRSVGGKTVEGCPAQTLSLAEAQALYERGRAKTRERMMGEYYRTDSLEAGLPMLKRAALHGVIPAMGAYAGHLLQSGAVDMLEIAGLAYPDATAEGMMWSTLLRHRGEPASPGDEETYRVLLDPSTPFPDGFFSDPSGTAWMFQMTTEEDLQWAREQAFAWRACW